MPPSITYGLNFPFDLNKLHNSENVIYNMMAQSHNVPIGAYIFEYGRTITVSGSCYPDFKASQLGGKDCARIGQEGLCDAAFHMSLYWGEQRDDGSWVTFLHCPECGCTKTSFPNFYNLAKA